MSSADDVEKKVFAFKKITHRGMGMIGDDRSVSIIRTDDGGFQFEWTRQDADNGNAFTSTKIALSEEAAIVTFELFAEMAGSIAAGKLQEAKPDEQE